MGKPVGKPMWDPQAFKRDWPKQRVLTKARNSKNFPWVVLCYCSPEGYETRAEWVNDARTLRLIDFKRFKDVAALENSQSYQRRYAPFNGKDVIVVAGRRASVCEYIVQYKLYDTGESS